MPFAIQGKIDGLSDLLKRLDSLEKKIRKKAVRKAAGEAGKIVLKDAKKGARTDTGLLRKSLGRKVKVYKGSGVAVAIVGPRVGFRQEVERGGRTMIANPVKYAHLVELGTAPHGYKTRPGQHPGAQAFPFLRPALDSNRDRIVEAMAEVFREALDMGGA